jgi:hypothetical protein
MVSKVAGATEEAREQVKGIMLLARTTTLFMLLNAFMAILVVDLARVFVDEDFVRFGYLNEFLVRLFVATVTR